MSGDIKTEIERSHEADTFIAEIQRRIKEHLEKNTEKIASGQKIQPSITTVPFFDIEYKLILQEIGETIQEDVTLEQVEKHLTLLKKYFGLKNLESIHMLKNQSICPIGNIIL